MNAESFDSIDQTCRAGQATNLFYFWHDPADLPPTFQKNLQFAREKYPDWNFTVLGDAVGRDLLARDWPDIAAAYDRIWIPACRSDIVRMAALYAYGGWYLDADTIPVGDLRPLTGDKNVIVFRDNRPVLRARGDVMNGFLYMPRQSQLAAAMLHRINRHIRKEQEVHRVMSFAGPYLLAQLIKKADPSTITRLWQSRVYKRYNTELVGNDPLFEHVVDDTASSWRILQNFGVMSGLKPDWDAFPDALRPRFVGVLRGFTEKHNIDREIVTLAEKRPKYAKAKGFDALVADCKARLGIAEANICLTTE